MDIVVEFWLFLPCLITKYGHEIRISKFFCPDSTFNIRKRQKIISGNVTKFLVEKLSTSEVISQKPQVLLGSTLPGILVSTLSAKGGGWEAIDYL